MTKDDPIILLVLISIYQTALDVTKSEYILKIIGTCCTRVV